MSDLGPQISRIRDKLGLAGRADPEGTAFGAAHHRHRLGPPLGEADVAAFEAGHGISLPSGYRAFLTQVGYGLPRHVPAASYGGGRAGAGPYYGLLPVLTDWEMVDGATLAEPPVLPDHPDAAAIRTAFEAEDMEDALFDQLEAQLHNGLLALCHEGCSAYTALVVSGPHRGQLVGVSLDMMGELFPLDPDIDFLGWYESWLDAVIRGPVAEHDFPGTVYLIRR